MKTLIKTLSILEALDTVKHFREFYQKDKRFIIEAMLWIKKAKSIRLYNEF